MVGLAEFDQSLEPKPVVAKGWRVLEGGKTIVFDLRTDVLWSDGKPVTAYDFEYSWKRLLDPKTASEYAYILFDLVHAEEFNHGKIQDSATIGVKALGNSILEVRLKQPASYFLALCTFEVTFPQRKDVIERYRDRWTDPEHIVTNGPFLLDSWKHESKIVLKANPRFFLGKPAVDRAELFMVNEKTTALVMYERGELDFADNHSLPIFEKERFVGQPGTRRIPQLRGYYYGFVVSRKPFDDVRVRRAFSMAVDRSIFPKILHGGEIPATCWIPPGMLAHNPNLGLHYNPGAAHRLLAEAGYPGGKNFPSVVLGYNTEEDNRIVAEAVQGMWQKNLGVVVKLENQEWKVYLSKLKSDPPHIFRLGWGADYPDPDNFMKLFTSSSGNNNTGWRNPRYDKILDEAAAEQDPRRRQRLYDQAQKILCDSEAPIIPLFFTAETTLLKPHLEGLDVTSMARLILRHVRPKGSSMPP
jgi:oligopeptide transport system substrate-binding protein